MRMHGHPMRLAGAVTTLSAVALMMGATRAAASPATVEAADLGAPGLGYRVAVRAPDGGEFTAEPGRALILVHPAGGGVAHVAGWCVDRLGTIREEVLYQVDLASSADDLSLAGPDWAAAGWLIARSDDLIRAAARPGFEAAAIQVAVWRLTGQAADRRDVTSDAQLDQRADALRSEARGRTAEASLTLAPASGPVAPGAPAAFTVTATPGSVVDLRAPAGTTLSQDVVEVGASGSATVTASADGPGPVSVTAWSHAGSLWRVTRLAGSSAPQSMAVVIPAPISASASVPLLAPPSAPPPVTAALAPVARPALPAVLGLVKAAPTRAHVGRPVPYALVVSNRGTVTARGVVVRDPVPRGVAVATLPPRARLRGGAIAWRLGDLAPGARVVLRARLRAVGPAGVVRNVAIASAANAAAVRAVAVTRVVAPARVRPAVAPVTG